MVRVAGSLQKSNDVMKLVNDSLKLPDMQKTMMEMSKEMQRAGLIEEMMTDAIDGALGDEELDTATEDEVDKILMEVAGETLAALPAAAAKKTQPAAAAVEEQQEEEESEDMAELQQRLNAVRT
eukprot:jgi/Chrzof1/1987/Cz10g28280.t1